MIEPSVESRGRFAVAPVLAFCLALFAVAPSIWLITQAETSRDQEFPGVDRSTYSAFPPRAYRWAEAGDTLDKLALYAAAVGLVIAGLGWWRAKKQSHPTGLWPAAFSLFAASGWQASTPWPTLDGWHGWNWMAMFDPRSPVILRLILAAAAVVFASTALWACLSNRSIVSFRTADREKRGLTDILVILGIALMACRWLPLPISGPPGYWPRWCFVWGLTAIAAACLRLVLPATRPRRWPVWLIPAAGVCLLLIGSGRWLIWYQRPLDRLRAVVPGKIFISAMPSYDGLTIATQRHGFRTIINVFNENTPQRSPRLPDELRFVKEHGLSYLGSPGDPLQADAFLDETLRLSQDPNAWPILVHCHGCMDRSPAWMGIYRFVVENRPLDQIMSEIEAHRGLRPKASVTLLYNRVLAVRAPERFASDPTARELVRNAHGTSDPFLAEVETARRRANSGEPPRVGQVIPSDTRRP